MRTHVLGLNGPVAGGMARRRDGPVAQPHYLSDMNKKWTPETGPPTRGPSRLSPSTRDRWRLRCSYLDCLGEEEQRNHDLALNGIFLETIDTVASTANTAVYAVLLDSFH